MFFVIYLLEVFPVFYVFCICSYLTLVKLDDLVCSTHLATLLLVASIYFSKLHYSVYFCLFRGPSFNYHKTGRTYGILKVTPRHMRISKTQWL